MRQIVNEPLSATIGESAHHPSKVPEQDPLRIHKCKHCFRGRPNIPAKHLNKNHNAPLSGSAVWGAGKILANSPSDSSSPTFRSFDSLAPAKQITLRASLSACFYRFVNTHASTCENYAGTKMVYVLRFRGLPGFLLRATAF